MSLSYNSTIERDSIGTGDTVIIAVMILLALCVLLAFIVFKWARTRAVISPERVSAEKPPILINVHGPVKAPQDHVLDVCDIRLELANLRAEREQIAQKYPANKWGQIDPHQTVKVALMMPQQHGI